MNPYLQDDEKVPASPDGLEEGDTSYAQNNEVNSDDSSPITSADEPKEDTERLKRKLQAKSRSERILGSVSAKATKRLVDLALSGDEEAKEDIMSDPELKDYVSKKYPSDWESINEEQAKETPETVAEQAFKLMQAKQKEDNLKHEIMKLGVKGQEDFNKIFNSAKSLGGMPAEIAAKAAYYAVKGTPPMAQPFPRNAQATPSYSSDDVKVDMELARNLGITPEDIKKYGPQLKNFKYGQWDGKDW